MEYTIIILASIWIGINLTALLVALRDMIDREYNIISPRYIYNSTKLNWVATWIVFILYLTVIVGYSLPYLIYWLTHMGRKD